MGLWIWILILLLGALLLYVISVYNRFQRLYVGLDTTFNQIKVALKKRLDLISQLVDAVKSYANFEKETLTKITAMRTGVMNVNSTKEISQLERESRGFLKNLLVTVENYPDLKTSETVKELMKTIHSVEDEISRHRYTYNNIVQEINSKCAMFPSNIIASIFHFKPKEFLQFSESNEELNKRPKIQF